MFKNNLGHRKTRWSEPFSSEMMLENNTTSGLIILLLAASTRFNSSWECE